MNVGTSAEIVLHSDAAIVLRKITKKYGSFTAVDNISFEVKNGEIFGLLGPNGAGKSTLIRMLTTLIPISDGLAHVGGFDVQRDPDSVRQTIGVIPQAMTSDLDLTVEENISIYAKLYNVSKAKRKSEIPALLEGVNLLRWRNTLTKHLSGGMRRRLEIARGLVHNPKIFFLDEPTSSLDPVSRLAVWEMLEWLRKTRGLTILITTHYMDEADRLCDRIAIVDRGQLVALDTPSALKMNLPKTSIIDLKLGDTSEDYINEISECPKISEIKYAGEGLYRIHTSSAVVTSNHIFDLARTVGFSVDSINIQSTTLNDVFAFYTGRQMEGDEVSEGGERRVKSFRKDIS